MVCISASKRQIGTPSFAGSSGWSRSPPKAPPPQRAPHKGSRCATRPHDPIPSHRSRPSSSYPHHARRRISISTSPRTLENRSYAPTMAIRIEFRPPIRAFQRRLGACQTPSLRHCRPEPRLSWRSQSYYCPVTLEYLSRPPRCQPGRDVQAPSFANI